MTLAYGRDLAVELDRAGFVLIVKPGNAAIARCLDDQDGAS